MVITKKIIIEYTQREMKRKSKSVTIKKLVRQRKREEKKHKKLQDTQETTKFQ